MSLYGLGDEDITEEQRIFKNKISGQDTQIAAYQTQLLKQGEELAEIKANLADALHKLNSETTRACKLENDLSRCTDNLNKEKLLSQNHGVSLAAAQEKLKAKDLEMRDFETTLETLSHQSNNHAGNSIKLQKANATLENRVRELEANLRLKSTPTPDTGRLNNNRRRSSSLSTFRIGSLETELTTMKDELAQRNAELAEKSRRLSTLQVTLNQLENEKIAMDRSTKRELEELRQLLADREDLVGDEDASGEREEELMRRIDDDAARISALELLLSQSGDAEKLKKRLEDAETRLVTQSTRVMEMESQAVELVHEKEEALDELEDAHAQIASLTRALGERDSFVRSLEDSLATARFEADQELSRDVERLLAAVSRLRGERDDLQRDLEFLQTETHFQVEAYELKIHHLTLDLKRADREVEEPNLDSRLQEAHDMLRQKQTLLQKFGVALLASAIVIQRVHDRPDAGPRVDDHPENFEETRAKLDSTAHRLSEATEETNSLQSRLELKEAELAEASNVNREAQATASRLDDRVSGLIHSLEQVESERDSLALQIANLEVDLATAQQELAQAEDRYSSLQFHQLNSMSSSEATHVLRERVSELEHRVMRRTEQIGIHQHDIKRLETNLRLQEERLTEMTAEMETLVSQKDAMVEDCADAREARDDALRRVEEMEESVEVMEVRVRESEAEVRGLIGVIWDTTSRARSAVQLVTDQRDHNRCLIEQLQHAHRENIQSNKLEEVEEVTRLKSRVQSLEHSLESRQTEIDSLKVGLQASQHQATVEQEVVQLKMAHIEELGTIQSRLVETSSRLEELEAHHEALKSDYQKACEDSSALKSRLEEAQQTSAQAETLHGEALRAQDDRIASLQERLSDALTNLGTAKAALTGAAEDFKEREASARKNHEYEVSQLRSSLHELQHTLDVEKGRSHEQLIALKEELVAEEKLRSVAERRLADADQRSSSGIQALKAQLETIQLDFIQLQTEAHSLREQRTSSEQIATSREADYQRAMSLNRFLERKIGDLETNISTLASRLEDKDAKLATAERSYKSAEVNLSLQEAQHNREVSQLQRELNALKARPDLTAVTEELEQRNTEMEELLREKCREIEENDDRSLEMLKENKKLLGKVETLTRKVQNLQTKLAAAKASLPPQEESTPSPSAAPEPVMTSRPRSTTLVPVSSSRTELPKPPVISVRDRIASGPSALPRPKTPERKMPAFSVFNPRSPAKTRTPSAEPSPSTPISRKRRVPDEFEVNPPVQAFTPECVPGSSDNGTPRARKVLSSIQSGFTPIRHMHQGRSSPKRGEFLLFSAGKPPPVFNAPTPEHLDQPPSKRSWLTKIRGTSTHTSARALPGQ